MKAIGMFMAAALVFPAFCKENPSEVKLRTDKSSAVVSLHGALVKSFKTGGEEVLWSPMKWGETGAKWCHGGIPLCWPWFGRRGPVTNCIHGLAARAKFSVKSEKVSSARSELVLSLVPTEEIRKLWPRAFELEYTIILTDSLSLRLRSKNTGKETLEFTGGFHPYFFIGDRDRTTVTGVDGLRYGDSRRTKRCDDVWKGVLEPRFSMDHVFIEPRAVAKYSIIDPVLDRTVRISAFGTQKLVIWNPGVEEAAFEKPAPGALAVGDWRHFICVEPANLRKESVIRLKPGETHEMGIDVTLGKGAAK